MVGLYTNPTIFTFNMAKKLDKIELIADMEQDLRIYPRGARAIFDKLRPYIGKTLIISIEEYEEKRSGAQNRWYWGCAVPTIIAHSLESFGETLTKDEVHFYNMMHVAGRKPVIKEVFGLETIVMEGKTTSQMSVKDFMNFKDALQKHYAERDCVIPDPSQENFLTDFINRDFKEETRPEQYQDQNNHTPANWRSWR